MTERGRHRKLTPSQVEEALRRYEAGESFDEMARAFGVHRMSLYRYFRESHPDRDRRLAATRSEKGWRIQREVLRRHWLTAGQAAEILSIDRGSICDFCRRGGLPGSFQMGEGAGAVWLIARRSVEKRRERLWTKRTRERDGDR